LEVVEGRDLQPREEAGHPVEDGVTQEVSPSEDIDNIQYIAEGEVLVIGKVPTSLPY
jgi:hypothetical protein